MNRKDKENMQYEQKREPAGYWIGAGLVLGAGVGGGFGTVFGDTSLWAAYGACVGILVAAILIKVKCWVNRRSH